MAYRRRCTSVADRERQRSCEMIEDDGRWTRAGAERKIPDGGSAQVRSRPGESPRSGSRVRNGPGEDPGPLGQSPGGNGLRGRPHICWGRRGHWLIALPWARPKHIVRLRCRASTPFLVSADARAPSVTSANTYHLVACLRSHALASSDTVVSTGGASLCGKLQNHDLP